MVIRGELAFVDHDVSTQWRQQAACVGHADEVNFFPERGESTQNAKAISRGVPGARAVPGTCVAHRVAGRMGWPERPRTTSAPQKTDVIRTTQPAVPALITRPAGQPFGDARLAG